MTVFLSKLKPGSEDFTLAVLFVVVTAFCGLPLVLLFKTGVISEGSVTLAPLMETMQSRSVLRALWNSLESSFLSAALATLVGTALALLIGMTNVRRKSALVFLILLPMMIPPHVTAIAWIQALGPASPVLRWLGIAPELGSTHPIYSRAGLVLLLALQHMPLVFIVVRASLRSFPRELSDAARVCRAGTFRLLMRITLPLLAPALLAGFMLAFVSALGNFGINALIGIPARYTTLPVLIWRRLASYGPDVLTGVALISLILALITLTALALQLAIQKRMRTALIGLPQEPLSIDLGRGRPLAEGILWLMVVMTLALPALSLLATALVKTYGLPLSFDTFTTDNFAEILWRQGVTIRAFLNSTGIAAIAAVLIAGMSVLLGYFLNAGRGLKSRSASLLAGQADIAYAVPGLVMSIALILVFLRPLPLLDISLYGTLGIILVAYIGVFLAIGLKPVSAAYMQLDLSLDDAARIAGAGFFRRMLRIFGPLVGPAAGSGAILVFLTAYNEVTVSALLWSAGNETIGTTIFNYEDGGYTVLAAAMAAVTVVLTVAIMAAMNGLARFVPRGAIPWRD